MQPSHKSCCSHLAQALTLSGQGCSLSLNLLQCGRIIAASRLVMACHGPKEVIVAKFFASSASSRAQELHSGLRKHFAGLSLPRDASVPRQTHVCVVVSAIAWFRGSATNLIPGKRNQQKGTLRCNGRDAGHVSSDSFAFLERNQEDVIACLLSEVSMSSSTIFPST